MRREHSVIEMLQMALDIVPLHLRIGSSLAYGLNEESLDKNLESIYQTAISRLTHIDYYFQWSYSLFQNPNTLPPSTDFLEVEGMLNQFNDLQDMKDEDTYILNNSFSKWIKNLLIRELDEFLQYYLLSIYETCKLVKLVDKELNPEDIVDMRSTSQKFEKSSLKERLKTLRNNFNIDITHKSELYSLHKLRNIFAHFDGVVQEKFCNEHETLKITWPINSVKLKHRKTGKLVPLEKVPRPFNKEYGEIQIVWLSTPKIAEYQPKDKIDLSHTDLNQLVFFYLYIFNEIHAGLVTYARDNDIKIRSFQEYSLTPSLCLIGDNDSEAI